MRWPLEKVAQTTLVLALSLAFLLGVAAAHSGLLIDWLWPLLAGAMAMFAWRRQTAWTLLWVMLLGLSLGWWRGSVYMGNLAQFQQYFGHKITIVATASEDATYNRYKQLTFDAHDVTVQGSGQQLVGKVALGGFGENAVYAGDVVRVSGKLYPGRGSYQGKLSYAQLTVTKRSTALVPEIRRRFVAGMQSALPEPLASFGMGLLIGPAS